MLMVQMSKHMDICRYMQNPLATHSGKSLNVLLLSSFDFFLAIADDGMFDDGFVTKCLMQGKMRKLLSVLRFMMQAEDLGVITRPGKR